MYPHVPAILECYKEIDEAFIMLQNKVTTTVEQRYASSLFGAMAVMKYLGLDWEDFFVRFIDQNSSTIQRSANISESENYLKAMMFNSVIFRDETKTSVSIAHLLANPERREEINAAGCGTYYDRHSQSLMFVVEQVITKLLPSHYRYRGAMTGTRLKEVLSRHRMAFTPEEVTTSGILSRATPYLGAGINSEDVVVIHANPWLVEGNVVANDATPAATTKVEKTEKTDAPPARDKDYNNALE
jgi:hypothetical protein